MEHGVAAHAFDQCTRLKMQIATKRQSHQFVAGHVSPITNNLVLEASPLTSVAP